MTADLLAPDEFAELLDTPEFAAMPAHERAKVFDAGMEDSRAWARENKLDEGFDGIEQALGVRYRPAEVDIQTSQQGPLKTAANAFANLGPEFVGGVVGGFARMGDAALEAVGISDPGQKSVLDRVAGAADSLQAEGELFYPTNPANPKAKTIGGGAGQGLALIGTAGLGAMAQIPRAGMYLPVLAGGAMGANKGIQTAEQMGIQNPLGKLGVGTGFAAIEAGTEMIGGIGGKFLPVVDGLKGAALNVLTEGAEEVIGGTAQDALTVAAGQAVADPARPGFTETGYQLPSLNPLDERFLAQRGQEFLGGAAGGAVFAGVQALSNASVNDRTVPTPPANQTVPDAGNGAGSTPAAGADLTPEEAGALPGDQALIANWEPIETALGTLAPVGGGNVIADFGIQRTPEAQAIVDAENAQRAAIEGQARGMQNMAGSGRPMIPDSPLGSYDILDFVNEHPLNVPRKGTELGKGGEYDWTVGFEMPAYYRKFLVSSERGYRPDDLAKMAYDEGFITDDSPGALLDKMQETMRTRTQYKAQFRQQRQELKQMEQQQVRFEKSQQQPTGKTQMPFDDLAPGDAFTINNEPVTIRKMEHDEDGNLTEIVIEDGKAFGVMSLDPQTRGGILVDKKSMQRAAPVPGMPSGTTLEQASNDPFNLTQATLPGPSTSEATTPAPASRATSDPAQFASGETSAFSSAEQTIVSNIRQAQLPRAKTPVGPIRAPGELVTLKQIRDHLLESTLLPRAGVRRFSQRALGIYKIKPETIRLRALNDLPTLAHEVGHAIHYRQLSPTRGGPAESWQGLYDAELMPLGQVTSAPNYTPDQVRNEGVAEFTRLWLTDPAAALKAAPRFASDWEMQMRALHPEMLERLRDSQRLIAQYTAMPGWERAKAQLVYDAEAQKPKRTWAEWTRRAYANWINTPQPFYDTLRAIGEADGALAAEAQRIRDNFENHRGGWQSKVQADVEIMQTDLNGKVIGPALKNILADISPAEHADFSTYLALRRAKELRGRGIKSGFEDALQHLTPQTMAEMVKRYEPTRKKLDAYQQNLIKMMVQSGLLSQKTADAMREANRDYVPFYRLYEKLNGIDTGAAAGRNAGGLVDVGTGIRRIKGSDLAIIDPLQSILRNTFMFRKLAEQNQIGADFFDLLGQMQGHGQFGDKIATRMKPTKISHETVVNKLIEAGVIQDANEIDADLAITLYSAIERPDSKTGEVIVRKDGKATHWQLNDPLLYTALKNADADSVHLFKDSPVLRAIFTIPARLMRFTATAGNPVFALKNWFRDQITAGIYSKTGFVPFWDGVKGAMKVITGHPDYNAWIMAGGKFSGLNASDKTYQAMIEELLPPQREARLAVRAMRSLRHVKKALTITSEILEEATRVQEFSRARAQGKNPMEAANLAKNVSMNFARAGQMSRKLNQIIPFFNAGLQDIDMIVRELANPKTRGAALMKGALYISIPSLIAWALGKDDEEIQNLPDWRKTQFWNFNLGPLAQLTGRPAFILSLPKPFLMGQLFGTSLERSLDQATARDPNGAKKAAQAILENTALHGDVTDFIPAALKPLVQIAFNRDTFRGQDIVPSNMQHLDKADQVLPTTSLTAQAIGKATGSSPLIIDSLLRGYLTGLGTLGSHGIDWAVTKATAGDRDNGPRTDLFEWQPFASFVGSPYAADANVGRFYAAADDMEGRLKQWNDRAPALDLKNTDDVQWWNKHRAEVMHYNNLVNPETKLTQAGQIRKLMRHLSDLNRAMKSTRNDPAMSPEQKRSTLIELSQTRNAAAKAGFALFPEPVRKKHY